MEHPAPSARPLIDLVDDHMDMWSEPDPGRRLERIRRCWHPDGALISPPLQARGHEAINRLLGAMQDHYPGHVLVRTSQVDAHHDTFRVGWEVRAPDGTPALVGIDVGIVDEDRLLVRLTGFFGDPPGFDEEAL
jgi:hypothetical protein